MTYMGDRACRVSCAIELGLERSALEDHSLSSCGLALLSIDSRDGTRLRLEDLNGGTVSGRGSLNGFEACNFPLLLQEPIEHVTPDILAYGDCPFN